MKYIAIAVAVFTIRKLSVFIPIRSWRRAFRNSIVGRLNYVRSRARFYELAKWEQDVVSGIPAYCGILKNGTKLCVTPITDTGGILFQHAYEIFAGGEYNFENNGEMVVIDVGMNRGLASIYLSARDDVVAVYAFEPVPDNFDAALANFKLNPYTKKVTPFNAGLGDGNYKTDMQYNPELYNSGTMIAGKGVSGSVAIKIQVCDAAEVVRKVAAKHPGKKLAIKSDCEGAELNIIKRLSAEGLLGDIDQIIAECHFNYGHEIKQLLLPHFRSVTKTGGGVSLIRASN